MQHWTQRTTQAEKDEEDNTVKHDLQSRRLLCDALNKLFWKCRMPNYMMEEKASLNDWANRWVAELRHMDKKSITGIKWSAKDCLFVPCREWRG